MPQTAIISPACNHAQFPADTWKHEEITFQLIQQYADRPMWDCSIQKPFRRLLGRIEFNQAREVWMVVNVERQPHSSRDIFISWEDALLHLHELVSQRQRQQRIEQLR